MFRGSRASSTPRQALLCPQRGPPRRQQPVVTGFCRGGLHCGRHTNQHRARSATKRGGIARHDAPTCRRHTPGRLRVVHNPHRHRYGGRRRDHGRAAALERSEGGAAGHVGSGAPWAAGCRRITSRRAEPKARGADGPRAAYWAHQAAQPHGRARRPENPRVHKQQPAPHSNTQCPTTHPFRQLRHKTAPDPHLCPSPPRICQRARGTVVSRFRAQKAAN